MKKINFAWQEGASTLQFPEPGSRVGFLRQHKDADAVPGPTEYTGVVEIYADGSYEFKMVTADKNGRGPKRSELNAVSRFIETLEGVKEGGWRRVKPGREVKGIGAFNTKLPKNQAT